VIGLRVKDGVVLAVEKLVHSKLLVPGANRRVQMIDRHIGLVRSRISNLHPLLTATQASSGLLADGRHIANRARDEAAGYRSNYRELAPLKVSCSRAISNCPRLTTSRLGVGGPSKPLCAGIYPLLFRTAIRL
jgi:20S proteasome subunit alpha 7